MNKSQPEKVSKSSVNFRRAEATGARCGKCAHFMAPSSCHLVAGTIRPNDVCNLYDKK